MGLLKKIKEDLDVVMERDAAAKSKAQVFFFLSWL